MKEIVLIVGRGIGQVMFQKSSLSGALMLIGILLTSWKLAVLAVLGNIVSTLTAYLSSYSREDINNGLYGFNGTLVGIAVGVFMPITISTIILLVVASCLSTWIARLFGFQHFFPGLTFPFVLVVWMLLIICSYLFPSLLLTSGEIVSEKNLACFQAFCLNIGQVMFQGANCVSGLLFLLAVWVNSRVNACYTILGALLPIGVTICSGVAFSDINGGLIGYNGVLCAIALGDKTWKGATYAILSILLSVVLQLMGMRLGITTLTSPFVFSIWIILVLQKLFQMWNRTSKR